MYFDSAGFDTRFSLNSWPILFIVGCTALEV
jgi:hypothetical protein